MAKVARWGHPRGPGRTRQPRFGARWRPPMAKVGAPWGGTDSPTPRCARRTIQTLGRREGDWSPPSRRRGAGTRKRGALWAPVAHSSPRAAKARWPAPATWQAAPASNTWTSPSNQALQGPQRGPTAQARRRGAPWGRPGPYLRPWSEEMPPPTRVWGGVPGDPLSATTWTRSRSLGLLTARLFTVRASSSYVQLYDFLFQV